MEHSAPLIIWANFFSDLAVDLPASGVLEHWAEQAPRKVWLMRPGDVLVTPVPPGPEFLAHACELLHVPDGSVTVVTVPRLPGTTMADAVERVGLTERLGALAAERQGARLLPVALDRATVALAARLGLRVAPYGPAGVTASAVDTAYRLNTKAGFRAVAGELGIRVPPGRVCPGGGLTTAVRAMLGRYGRVVVKPDRSAGGCGLTFLSRAGSALGPIDHGASGTWVVERCLDVARSVSVQLITRPGAATRVVHSGEMRTAAGSYTGYVSPLHGVARRTVRELERWGTALGAYLAARGYAGPYGLDAVVTADGTLYATESNVRRTATTTPQAMVERLARTAGFEDRAWLVASGRTPAARGFADTLRQLRAEGLAWSPGTGEGVVLYGDAPADGRSWRYAVIGPGPTRVAEIETALARALAFVPPSGER
ncbi:preATP grasp domain-containing protein [Streptomyces wuyuanensis]|uniref:preATP grasp domain-containing protein n=1 Tax=Streptomyces wuyuanensis TaxID=1196353 RepID=UPI0036988FED